MLARDVQGAVRTVNMNLTVRLLVSGSGSGTSKLLGLVSSGISDQQRAVELDEDVLDLLLALLVNVLLVVRHQRLGERLPDGVDLGHVATALHTDADVNVSKPENVSEVSFEFCLDQEDESELALLRGQTRCSCSIPVLSKKQNWLHELELQSSRLHQLQRAAIHLDETLPPLAVGHGGGSLLATEGLDRLYGLLLVSHSSF